MVLRGELVPGNLFDQEAVERLIAIERFDDIIAKAPGFGKMTIVFESLGFGKSRQVKPVLRPAFAVMRAVEQPIDHALEGIGRRFVLKCRNFIGRGGQTEEVE